MLHVGISAPNSASPSTTGPAPETHVAVLTADHVIRILDDTVDWYRTLGTQQQNANQPSDLLILFANRQTADRVVSLAFEIARANAELLSSEAGIGQSATGGTSPQALDQQQAQLEAQRQSIQQEIDARSGHRGKSGESDSKLTELRGELAMVSARKNLLDTMTAFVDESDPKGAGANALKTQIDAIAATVPQASANLQAVTTTSTAAAPAPPASSATGVPSANGVAASSRYGIVDLGRNVMALRNKIITIDSIDHHTAELAGTFQTISAAPLEQLKAFSVRSDALAKLADTADSATLKSLRGEFDTLAWLFKQTSAILIPLTEEEVLLQQYRRNLATWRDATLRQYREAWAALGIRVGVLLGLLAAVFVMGDVWRRAVLRYAHEPRRRYSLLLLRKIVLWTVVIGIVALSFITEISALATFAGLLTAGVAVAMQSVLVSVVGYFFLIGKYGIRIGDRIQIGNVVGEVIELGLVRMHLMELNTSGPLGPTGRVVAFANLIVFQASGGLFKQIPGVNLAWHETTLMLPPVEDYAALKAELLSAVSAIVGEYAEEISRQSREIERTTSSAAAADLVPQVQMHLSSDGHMEATFRYPVHGQHAAEIEERVSAAVLKVIAAQKVGGVRAHEA
jgi:hypothetical protein